MNADNSINQEHIYKVHSLDSAVDAKRIKEASTLFKDFTARFGGLAPRRVSLNYVLWEYGAEISNLYAIIYAASKRTSISECSSSPLRTILTRPATRTVSLQ
jgi:hypothetical protein